MKVTGFLVACCLTSTITMAVPTYRGVTMSLNSSAPEPFDYRPFVREIAELGANSVAFLIPYYQADHTTNEIRPLPPKTPNLERIRETTQEAHRLGLKVLYLPVSLLEDETIDEWRGSLQPTNLDAWFDSWESLLLPLASLAEEEEVAILSVGSEFNSLVGEEQRWRDLILSTRSVYSGQVIYTCNWDVPDQVLWWDALDAMSISAYYELAMDGELDASVESLTERAVYWRDWLVEIHERLAPEKPLLLTEFGFPSLDGGAIYPWDYTMTSPIDYEEQRRGVEAVLRAWAESPALEGAFYFGWVEFLEVPTRGYSVRGKPAEELLRSWFTQKGFVGPEAID